MSPSPTRRTRAAAWTIILAAAALEAYARRHSMTPDGVSYLDLSDAVVAGDWSGLVDGYWSPLYPALVGLARLLTRPSPAREFAAVHALNFVLFALTLPAFDWFYRSLIARARDWRRSAIHSRWAPAAAYVLFGALSLTMTPLELPTPDLLVSSELFVVFGAILRLDMGLAPVRNALILGTALAMAVVTKSFFVPWSAVCLACVALGTWKRLGVRPVAVAAGLWLAATVPWTLAVSHHVGHLSFGETGRLTYAWFVNNQEPPALLVMPSATETPQTSAVLPGVGVTGDAPGTNPAWRDPSRFSGGLTPHWDAGDQLATVRTLLAYYVKNLAPLIFAALFALGAAVPGSRRLAWRRGWMIWVPSLAAYVVYGLVVVTTRYIVAFLVVDLALLAAALPWPRVITQWHALAAVGIPLAAVGLVPGVPVMLGFLNAVVMAITLAFALRNRPLGPRLVLVVLGTVATRLILTPVFPTVVRTGAVLLAILFWRVAETAERTGEGRRFVRIAGAASVICIGLLIAGRIVLRLVDDAGALGARNSAELVAERLPSLGITPGTRIALVGSPYDAYWARTSRLHIIGVVPPPVVDAFWQLPAARRDGLLTEFAAAGARYAISVVPPSGDGGWLPTGVGGWYRRLQP